MRQQRYSEQAAIGIVPLLYKINIGSMYIRLLGGVLVYLLVCIDSSGNTLLFAILLVIFGASVHLSNFMGDIVKTRNNNNVTQREYKTSSVQARSRNYSSNNLNMSHVTRHSLMVDTTSTFLVILDRTVVGVARTLADLRFT
jgi:hypothetical protein